jgi:hypothetical protein
MPWNGGISPTTPTITPKTAAATPESAIFSPDFSDLHPARFADASPPDFDVLELRKPGSRTIPPIHP